MTSQVGTLLNGRYRLDAQIGALDRVQEVPARAVRLVPARLIGVRQEHAASVAVEPVQVE